LLTPPAAQVAAAARAFDAMASRMPKISCAQLEAAGKLLRLNELTACWDVAAAELVPGDASIQSAALVQALLWTGLAFRFVAPQRPNVLAWLQMPGTSCRHPDCTLPDCAGNRITDGMFIVVHDKTVNTNGPRPPLALHPTLLTLHKAWLDWARPKLAQEDTTSLFVTPTGVPFDGSASSAMLPASMAKLGWVGPRVTSNSVRAAACAHPRPPHPQLLQVRHAAAAAVGALPDAVVAGKSPSENDTRVADPTERRYRCSSRHERAHVQAGIRQRFSRSHYTARSRTVPPGPGHHVGHCSASSYWRACCCRASATASGVRRGGAAAAQRRRAGGAAVGC